MKSLLDPWWAIGGEKFAGAKRGQPGGCQAVVCLAAAHCEFAVFATFAGWGADAARHPNLSVGTYARRLKIDGFPPATVWWRVAVVAPSHRRTAHRRTATVYSPTCATVW